MNFNQALTWLEERLTIQVGKPFGIPLIFHWSFFVALGLFSLLVPMYAALIPLVFAFVILHEYGHALTAKKLGIECHSITLYPIGGIARIKATTLKPKTELLITAAGPLVNIILGGLFFVLNLILNQIGISSDIVYLCMAINLALAVFNLICALPLDGGRILRSVITMITGDPLKATQISVFVSHCICALFFVLGIFTASPNLLLIAPFLYMAANKEKETYEIASDTNKILLGIELYTRDYCTRDQLKQLLNEIRNPILKQRFSIDNLDKLSKKDLICHLDYKVEEHCPAAKESV